MVPREGRWRIETDPEKRGRYWIGRELGNHRWAETSAPGRIHSRCHRTSIKPEAFSPLTQRQSARNDRSEVDLRIGYYSLNWAVAVRGRQAVRDEGEGRDWEGFETEDRDDWED